jgi:hypothetical protein
MTTYTRAFYAWLIQPTDTCPKWVDEAAFVVALLITCWEFVVYCCKTGREQLYEFNDALAVVAVRLTCTAEDIEYYNRLQHQAQNTEDFCDFGYVDDVPTTDCWIQSIVDLEVDKVWPFLNEAELDSLVDKVTMILNEYADKKDLAGGGLQPASPNRATRRRRKAKNG